MSTDHLNHKIESRLGEQILDDGSYSSSLIIFVTTFLLYMIFYRLKRNFRDSQGLDTYQDQSVVKSESESHGNSNIARYIRNQLNQVIDLAQNTALNILTSRETHESFEENDFIFAERRQRQQTSRQPVIGEAIEL